MLGMVLEDQFEVDLGSSPLPGRAGWQVSTAEACFFRIETLRRVALSTAGAGCAQYE